MRVGKNPKLADRAPMLEKIVLQVITHLPNQIGYHKDRLEVIKLCLRSMCQGVHLPYSLIVWDHESIPELIEWVQDEIKPTLLINSVNVGKQAARKMMAGMVSPDSIICYSDDDMLFYDNWLVPQLNLLAAFPNVASVSGYPVRTSFRWGNTHTLKWARRFAKIETGRFIPDEWEQDFAVSIGRDINEHKVNTVNDVDARIEYKGYQAYATSHHCQQIGYAGMAARAIQYDGLVLGEERSMDERMDKLGLRLATTKRLCRHIGNVIDNDLRQDIETVLQAA